MTFFFVLGVLVGLASHVLYRQWRDYELAREYSRVDACHHKRGIRRIK